MKKSVFKRRKDGIKQRYHVNVNRRSRVDNNGLTPEDFYPDSGLSISEADYVRQSLAEPVEKVSVPVEGVVRKRAPSKKRVKRKTVIYDYDEPILGAGNPVNIVPYTDDEEKLYFPNEGGRKA